MANNKKVQTLPNWDNNSTRELALEAKYRVDEEIYYEKKSFTTPVYYHTDITTTVAFQRLDMEETKN